MLPLETFSTPKTGITIIVPFLNERAEMPALLSHLSHWRNRGNEVLLVDGGSRDGSGELAFEQGFSVLHSKRGRAQQMNTGARVAKGDILVFLHADSRLPDDADTLLQHHFNESERGQALRWGRFDVCIDGSSAMFPVIAWFMNRRSRWSGIATGDQALFVRADEFQQVGGYPQQPLMEDVALSQRLKQQSKPLCLSARVHTSGRRWLKQGVWRTILLMWKLRWLYWRGVSATTLAKYY